MAESPFMKKGARLPEAGAGGGIGMTLRPISQTRINKPGKAKAQASSEGVGGEVLGEAVNQAIGTGSKWYSKRPDINAAKPSTFHERQLAQNKPGQRSTVRRIQEDVLRESEEKRSRYRMGYDD